MARASWLGLTFFSCTGHRGRGGLWPEVRREFPWGLRVICARAAPRLVLPPGASVRAPRPRARSLALGPVTGPEAEEAIEGRPVGVLPGRGQGT